MKTTLLTIILMLITLPVMANVRINTHTYVWNYLNPETQTYHNILCLAQNDDYDATADFEISLVDSHTVTFINPGYGPKNVVDRGAWLFKVEPGDVLTPTNVYEVPVADWLYRDDPLRDPSDPLHFISQVPYRLNEDGSLYLGVSPRGYDNETYGWIHLQYLGNDVVILESKLAYSEEPLTVGMPEPSTGIMLLLMQLIPWRRWY